MYEVKDKVVLITGGANGIGEAFVRQIYKENPKFVGILDIDVEKGIHFEKELGETYGKNKVTFIKCDVTNDEELMNAFKIITEKNGNIDVIVNNAGVMNEDMNDYRQQIKINYTAVVTGTMKALELMRRDRGGKGGTVINISSTAAMTLCCPCFFVYGGTKSAVLHFSSTIGMPEYYCKTHVRVLTICFGGVKSDMLSKARSFDPELTENINIIVKEYMRETQFQTCEFAGHEMLEVYKRGESGSTWLINNNKPAVDITPKIKQAYNILSAVVYE